MLRSWHRPFRFKSRRTGEESSIRLQDRERGTPVEHDRVDVDADYGKAFRNRLQLLVIIDFRDLLHCAYNPGIVCTTGVKGSLIRALNALAFSTSSSHSPPHRKSSALICSTRGVKVNSAQASSVCVASRTSRPVDKPVRFCPWCAQGRLAMSCANVGARRPNRGSLIGSRAPSTGASFEPLLERGMAEGPAALCTNEEISVVAITFAVEAAQQFDNQRRRGTRMLSSHLHARGRYRPNAALKSTSLHRALSTSCERAAVSTANANAWAATPPRSSKIAMNAGISLYGRAAWCLGLRERGAPCRLYSRIIARTVPARLSPIQDGLDTAAQPIGGLRPGVPQSTGRIMALRLVGAAPAL